MQWQMGSCHASSRMDELRAVDEVDEEEIVMDVDGDETFNSAMLQQLM